MTTNDSYYSPSSNFNQQSGGKSSFMGMLLERFGSEDKVVEFLKKDIENNPIDGRLNLQVVLNLAGREEEAFAICEELMRLAPADPRVMFNSGWHWIHRGQLHRGLTLLEAGREIGVYGSPRLKSSRPIWNRHAGYGQRVHLYLEAGMGDEIIYFRFGKDLVEKYGCKVTVICRLSLAPLFAREKWVSAVLQVEAALGVYHDSWLPGMSAAQALGYEIGDISGAPYLTASDEKKHKWGQILNMGGRKKTLNVGLRWAGNPDFEHQQFRVFPPETVLDLAKNFGDSNVQFYSFQKESTVKNLPEGVVDIAPWLMDWDETAAAMKNMDLIITSCTSVAHASAALGITTWVIVPALPYYVWALHGNKSPWYGSVTLIRQKKFGCWKGVQEEVQSKFAEFVKTALFSSDKGNN
ncbi:MAG: hypothetical protein ACKOX6_18660 [Bdellovibrio sp.]